MSADNPHPADNGIEKQAARPGDKPPPGTPITKKSDNDIQQRAQQLEDLRTKRLTQDPNNAFTIADNGKIVQDKRPLAVRALEALKQEQERSYKTAGYGDPNEPVGKAARQPTEQAARTTDTDYKPLKTGDHSFALGVNRQETPDSRTPGEKLQDFMQSAAKRATDPEGWKAWAQGEINKFGGIGLGLNEAKEETKTAVAAGWKAMTDGTVIEFLSQPNAINAPVFKTVQNAFEAMSKDPEATNKALEALGKLVMKASEGYSNLPDSEKGKVIGKVMFGMINPEGDLKDAEAALKLGDQVAIHVDKLVTQTVEQSLKTVEELAKSSPEIAQQTKQMLYDFLKSKGLTPQEYEYAGVPKGFFDGIQPTEVAAKDNYLAMSKADDVAGDGLPKKSGEPVGETAGEIQYQIDKATGRLQRTDMGEIREPYKWNVLNEHFAPDAIRQSQNDSCVSTVGEMLSGGRITEKELIAKLGTPGNILRLPEALGPEWTTKGGPTSLAEIGRDGPWAAQMIESEWTKFPKPPHVVLVEGPSPAGNVMIRDPLEGTRYEMTVKDFLKTWNRSCAYRRVE